MTFKAKLRQIGNSIGVLIPKKVITGSLLGEVIELEVITKGDNTPNKDTDVITPEQTVITPVRTPEKRFNTESCSKHEGSMKGTCGCK